MSAHNGDYESAPMKRPGEPGRSISGVGMLTADRPALLRRGLASYIQNAARHLRQVEYVVFDDSKDVANRRATREAATALARKFKVEMRYAGPEERAGFARRLEDFRGISKNVLVNALLHARGYTTGQNRNALLLDSVGTLVLCTDDDTVCNLAAPPGPAEKLELCAGADPAEFWFFRNFAEACAAASPVDRDFLGAHEALLGRTVDALCSSGPSVHARDSRAGLRTVRPAYSVVRVTLNGLLGDCAWGAPFGFWHAPMGYLAFDSPSLERLISSEERYRQTMRSRQVLRITASQVLSDASFSMLTCCGLDNRELLPPNLPVNRGQDLIFGQTLWKCFSNAAVGHVPLAVVHDPRPRRRFWDGEILRTAAGVDVCRLIIEAVELCEFSGVQASPQERLERLGQNLVQLADRPERDLGGQLLERLRASNRRFELQIAQRARRANGNGFHYARDVFRYCEKLRISENQPDYWVPLELRLADGTLKPKARTRAVLRGFGELLIAWPEIVKRARLLRKDGVRLSVPV